MLRSHTSLTGTPVTVDLADEHHTTRLAAQLAAVARRGDVLALTGDLGIGKTAFARAFIRARTDPQAEVPSPTFTLVQVYTPVGDAVPIYHIDLYRIGDPDDALELGIEEAFDLGISLIEWPDRLGRWLPDARLAISFRMGETETARKVTLVGAGDWPERLKDAIDD